MRQAHTVFALIPCLERLDARGASTSGVEQTFGQVNAFCGVMADAVHTSESYKNDTLELLDTNQWPQAMPDHWIELAIQEWLAVYGTPRASGSSRIRRTDLGAVKQTKPDNEKRWIQDRPTAVNELVAGTTLAEVTFR